MKVGIYDQYLDTLGGGEKYILTIASLLSKENDVDIFWDHKEIIEEAVKKFDLNLSNVRITNNIFEKQSRRERVKETSEYDAFFAISDGSIPVVGSRKLFLIYQFYHPSFRPSFFQKLKLRRVTKVLCYSDYVKEGLDKILPKKATVLYPPVDAIGRGTERKKKMILTVGRFTKGNNTKKQDVLINTFKKLCDDGLSGWEFHLAGSYLPEDEDLVRSLKDLKGDYPIFFHENISHNALVKLYQEAALYWHAAGFGEKISEHPERAEHFGITTVEAMSAGAVPVVIDEGGQKEIVENGVSGYTWKTLEELAEKTRTLTADENLMRVLSDGAEKRSEYFSEEVFKKNLKTLLT